MNKYSSAVVLAVMATIFIVYLLMGSTEPDNERVYLVQIAQSKEVLIERGVVKSSDASPIRAGASGTIIEIAEHGTFVKKGEQLFRMDNSEAVGWYEDAQERIESHKSEQRKTKNELSVVQLEERNRRLVNEADLELAKINLQLEEMGLTKNSQRILEIDLLLTQMNLEEKQEELERNKRLFEKGLSSQSDIDKAERNVIAAKARVEEQKINNNLLKQGATLEELEELKSQVALKEFQVAKGDQDSERKLRKIKSQLKVVEEKLNVEYKDMTISGAQVDGAISYATRDGIAINKGFTDWRNAGRWMPNTIGTERWVGDVIFEIIDPRQMCIEILINEMDRPLIEEGQNVSVYIAALQNRHFTGRISYIGGIGRDRLDAATYREDLGKTKVTVYNAIVELDDVGDQLRPGMSAMVHMPVKETTEYVLIPMEYVTKDGDRYLVTKEGVADPVEISGELKGTKYFEVHSGLANGDKLSRP